ncbi:DNA damage-binding protein CMR1 [Euphorbia peplus]|nr:DNA damage-binding protein CMR1 [Euphorbia peplus]
MAPKKLSEYEKKRLENIRRNEEMLAALKVSSKASELSASSKPQREEPTRSYNKRPKPDSTTSVRRSLRNRGIPPDLEDSDVETPNPNPDQFQKLTGPVTMSDAYNGTHSDRLFIDKIRSLGEKPLGEFVLPIKSEIGVRDKDKAFPYDFGLDMVYKNVENCIDLQSMTLEPENVARVVPGRIMILKFFPCNDFRMIAAGNEVGNVAFWTPGSSNEEGNGVYLYRPHTAPISGIMFMQDWLSKIVTSSQDGFLRMMDVEKEIFDEIYSSKKAIFSLSQRPHDMSGLFFGEGYGEFSIKDVRKGGLASNWMLHQDRINSIDFNPQNPLIMATGSTDGTVSLWDLRLATDKKPDALKTIKHNRAVYSACFSPSGSYFATTSADDTMSIFNCADFEDNFVIDHGRGASSFRCTWGWDDTYLYMGNTKRGIDVISRSQGSTILTLESPHMSAIPCRFDIHPYNVGMLAGGTSGGQVYMWTGQVQT